MTMDLRSWMQRFRPAGFALMAAALSVLSFGDAGAQSRGDRRGDIILDAAGAPGGDFNVSEARRQSGFRLFAAADGAGIGMRHAGNMTLNVDNYSPCDNPINGFCEWEILASRGGGVVTFQFFEVLFAAGVPQSEWAKARKIAPSIANAKGGGYSYLTNFGLFSGRYEWGPRDGSLSELFSGVTATTDGSCRDFSGFGSSYFSDFASGAPLLPASTCTPTWPGNPGVWKGDREIAEDGWKTLFDADPDAFTWNYWQVPDSLKKPGPFIGTNFSTYGESSDHFLEVLGSYGEVIPGGSGAPTVDGWPLGLVWRFEVFNFGVPSLASVQFFRATVINRSEDVYGVGLDYDSLYIGFQPGTGGSGGGGGQRFSNYYLPEIGTALYHQSYVTAGGPCSEGARRPSGVSTCASIAGMGMNNGGNAIVVLKSPIGDLRNKMFSDPASKFYNPTHPNVGDTITFNHGHQCGFGSCWATTINVNDKRSFGMISSNADLVLDGRDPASLTNGEAWLTFRTRLFPTERGKFNKYIPNGGTGWGSSMGLDTLYLDSCAEFGCVVSSSDTAPGGQLNAYGNVGGTLAAGPFPLAAGDSTSWYVALVGDADSSRTWASIDAAIGLYMTFFLSPEAPPPVNIASTQVVAGTEGRDPVDPEVRFFWDDAPEKWVDQFLLNVSTAMNAGDPAYTDILAKNPDLADEVEDRAFNNLARLEIYKSCDGGNSWTSDNDCVGDPATDERGRPVGLGWQAYQIFDADDDGDVPNSYLDRNVTPGRSYLYTVVAVSRGAKFYIIGSDDRPDSIEFAPSIGNPLSRSSSDPNVLSVYIPASRAAGYQAATLTFSETGAASVPFSVDVSDRPTGGAYAVSFGNRITVERDSIVAADACGEVGTVCGTRVILERIVNGTTSVSDLTLFREGADVFPVQGAPSSTGTAVVGNFSRTTETYNTLGFVVSGGTVPLYGSITLTGSDATPTAAFALPDFPGFTVSADNQLQRNFWTADETAYRGATTLQQLGLPDTAVTVPRGNVDAYMAQWREQNSTPVSLSSAGGSIGEGTNGLGRYVLRWRDDAFGAPRGISQLGSGSEAELQQALTGRTAGTTGLTDAETATLLDAALPNAVTQQDLVAVKAPFTVTNATYDRPVSVAMLKRSLTQAATVANTYRIGRNADTLRVSIPEDEWVPGDLLYFIEDVTRDSVAGGAVVLDGSGNPIQVTNPTVTFTSAVIGCNAPNPPFCNPLGVNVRGASGYLGTNDGDSASFTYYVGFQPGERWVFDLVPPVAGTDITQVTDSMLAAVRVVPNPFVVYSQYQTSIGDSRIMFTNVPPRGALRVYTISGQFVQQITWTPEELSATGDLLWNLKSREDIDIASGLYLWVLTAPSNPTDENSTPVTARGKFVVIRGQPR